MANVKTILRNTNTKVSAKLAFTTSGDLTIAVATDVIDAAKEVLTSGGTPTVNIVAMWWSGAAGEVLTVTRNSVIIVTLPCGSPGSFDFEDVHFVDPIGNTSDIVVSSTGLAQLYITLRKVTGYSSFVENATYGAYDDPTELGARTDISGSPDYIVP